MRSQKIGKCESFIPSVTSVMNSDANKSATSATENEASTITEAAAMEICVSVADDMVVGVSIW